MMADLEHPAAARLDEAASWAKPSEGRALQEVVCYPLPITQSAAHKGTRSTQQTAQSEFLIKLGHFIENKAFN